MIKIEVVRQQEMKNIKVGSGNVVSRFTYNILGHLGMAVNKEEKKLEEIATAVATAQKEQIEHKRKVKIEKTLTMKIG